MVDIIMQLEEIFQPPKMMGINGTRIRILNYVLSGVMAAIAALIMTSRLGDPDNIVPVMVGKWMQLHQLLLEVHSLLVVLAM